MAKSARFLGRRAKQLIMVLSDVIAMPAALWTAFLLHTGTLRSEFDADRLAVRRHRPLHGSGIHPLGLYRAVSVSSASMRQSPSRSVSAFRRSRCCSSTVLSWNVRCRSPFSRSILRSRCLYVGASRFGARELLRMGNFGAEAGGHLWRRFGRRAVGHLALHQPAFPARGVRGRQPEIPRRERCAACRYSRRRNCPSCAARRGVELVFLALPSASRRRRGEIIERLSAQGFKVQTVPDISEIVSGQSRLEEIRDIDVHDLLGRDPVPPNPALLSACIRGKSILVTGAGGSIGSELCRQIMALAPRRLVLLEVSELALYEIERELRSRERAARQSHRAGRAAGQRAPQASRARDHDHVRDPDRVSRGCVQARADRRTQHDRGHSQQHLRHLQHGRSGARMPRRNLRAHLHRQGGESDQRHGLHQACRRDGAAGSAAAQSRHALLHGALRQRARVLRFGRAAVPRADSRRRARSR